jgi:hypothetical protein
MPRRSSRLPGFRSHSGYLMTHVLLALGRATGPLEFEVERAHGLDGKCRAFTAVKLWSAIHPGITNNKNRSRFSAD